MERSLPEQQNVSSKCIINFLDHLRGKKLELHSLMIIKNGFIITEGWWSPYRPTDPHVAYSLTKSFTSIAVGLAAHEKLIKLNDLVIEYFPRLIHSARRSGLDGITIRHLLTMATGHHQDTTRFKVKRQFIQDRPDVYVGDQPDGDWIQGFFELPAEHEPGSYFIYNSGASQVLATIIRKAAGCPLPDYLQPRLFDPLGISRPVWETNSRGDTIGGWGLRLKTEDVARFGQLLLQNGFWQGKQIVPSTYIAEATVRQISTDSNDYRQAVTGAEDWLQGYGYHFWQCRHGAYRGDGAFGQFCLVLPAQNTVIAINAGVVDMQGVLNAVWSELLPGLSASQADACHDTAAELAMALKTLDVAPTGNAGANPFIGTAEYRINPNDDQITAVKFCFRHDINTLTWRDSTQEYSLDFKLGFWQYGCILAGEQVAAKGSWSHKGLLTIDICRINTPYHDRLACSFDENHLLIEYFHLDFIEGSQAINGTMTSINLG